MASGKNDRVGPSREKDSSPFTPGNPVPVELFVGRAAEIEQIQRLARQACTGRLENVFLSGDRGIGKSSLAHFIRELCAKESNMLGIHVLLGGVSSLEEMVRRLFEQLLKETHTQSWFGKIRGMFGDFIREVGLFGVSVGFAPPRDQLEGLVSNFPAAIKNVFSQIQPERSGLFVVLDDLNGLATQEVFANWYKSFVDFVATQGWNIPALFMLCGLPEKRDALAKLQPSLMRVFRVVDIEKLSADEVKDFVLKAFQKVAIAVEPKALEVISHAASGLPALMHEIGDATYWVDDDGVIDGTDAVRGVVEAAEEVGKKYLDPKVYHTIRSTKYRAILSKLVRGDPASDQFVKRDVEARLDDKENRVFHNFLQKMKDLGVVESDAEQGRGAYRFVNRMFPIYIFLRELHAERSRRGERA